MQYGLDYYYFLPVLNMKMTTHRVTLYNFTGLPLSISDGVSFNYDLSCDISANSFVAPSLDLKISKAASYSVSSTKYSSTAKGYQIAPFKFTVPAVSGDSGLFLAVDRSSLTGKQVNRGGYITQYNPSDSSILYLKCVNDKIVSGDKIMKNFAVVPYTVSGKHDQMLVAGLIPVGVKKGDINLGIQKRIKAVNDWIVNGVSGDMSWLIWILLFIVFVIIIAVIIGSGYHGWKYYQSKSG